MGLIAYEFVYILRVNNLLGHSEGRPCPWTINFEPFIDPVDEVLVIDDLTLIEYELVSPTGSNRTLTE